MCSLPSSFYGFLFLRMLNVYSNFVFKNNVLPGQPWSSMCSACASKERFSFLLKCHYISLFTFTKTEVKLLMRGKVQYWFWNSFKFRSLVAASFHKVHNLSNQWTIMLWISPVIIFNKKDVDSSVWLKFWQMVSIAWKWFILTVYSKYNTTSCEMVVCTRCSHLSKTLWGIFSLNCFLLSAFSFISYA